MEESGERAEIIGSAGDGGMDRFGIGNGHVSAIGEVDGPRSYHLEFGCETTSAMGPKGFEIGQEVETAAGDNESNCIIAGLTLDPNDFSPNFLTSFLVHHEYLPLGDWYLQSIPMEYKKL